MIGQHIQSRSTAVFEPGPGSDTPGPVVILDRPVAESSMTPFPSVLAEAIGTLVNAGFVTTVGDVWDFISEEFPQLNYTVVLVSDIPPVFTANGRMVVVSVSRSCPGQFLELA